MPEMFYFLMPDIERVLYVKLLCVWLQADMRTHVDYILNIFKQMTYLLTQLKRQGLPQIQLQCVFDAIIVARLFECSKY